MPVNSWTTDPGRREAGGWDQNGGRQPADAAIISAARTDCSPVPAASRFGGPRQWPVGHHRKVCPIPTWSGHWSATGGTGKLNPSNTS
jgi:hypothetical protein